MTFFFLITLILKTSSSLNKGKEECYKKKKKTVPAEALSGVTEQQTVFKKFLLRHLRVISLITEDLASSMIERRLGQKNRASRQAKERLLSLPDAVSAWAEQRPFSSSREKAAFIVSRLCAKAVSRMARGKHEGKARASGIRSGILPNLPKYALPGDCSGVLFMTSSR